MKTVRAADIVTYGNAFCGVLAILLAASGNIDWAVRLIALAFFFDALDGPIARILGPTDAGKLLDRVSDRISQAFAPAFVLAALVDWHFAAMMIVCLVVLIGLYRLVCPDADPENPTTFGVTLGPISLTVIIGYWVGFNPWVMVSFVGFIALLNLIKIPFHIPQSVRKPSKQEGVLKTARPIIWRAAPFVMFALLPTPFNLWLGLAFLAFLGIYIAKKKFFD